MKDNRIIIRGNGLPIVILPGLSISSYVADEIIAKEFQNIAEYKIITLNIPGQGGLEPIENKNNRNATGLASHLIAVLDEYGIEKFALVGISLGGCPAIKIAAQYPERIEALVLQGVPYRGKNMNVLQRKLFFSLYDTARLIGGNTNIPIEKTTEWLVNNIEKVYTKYRVRIHNNNLGNQFQGLNQLNKESIHWESYIDYIHFILKQDLTSIAASIPKGIKTLLIDGANPEQPLVNTSLELAKIIPGAGKPVLIENYGHLLPWIKPDIFVNEVCEFFVACDYK